MPSAPIRILLVEDNPVYAKFIRAKVAAVYGDRFQVNHVSSLAEARAWLAAHHCDVALVDLGLPDSSGVGTLRRIQERVPDVALIAFTGIDDEKTAMEALAAGAQDYLVKGQDDIGLVTRAIRYAIERKRLENVHVHLNQELARALAEVRALSAMLPLCVNCKSVRNDRGYWERIEEYIRARTGSAVSHALCPACAQGLYGELATDLPS